MFWCVCAVVESSVFCPQNLKILNYIFPPPISVLYIILQQNVLMNVGYYLTIFIVNTELTQPPKTSWSHLIHRWRKETHEQDANWLLQTEKETSFIQQREYYSKTLLRMEYQCMDIFGIKIFQAHIYYFWHIINVDKKRKATWSFCIVSSNHPGSGRVLINCHFLNFKLDFAQSNKMVWIYFR